MPDCLEVSSREPVPTQTPTHKDATSGIDSVTSLMPLSSVAVVITGWTVPASRSRATRPSSAPAAPRAATGPARAAAGPLRRATALGPRRPPPAGDRPAMSAGPRFPKVDSSSLSNASSNEARPARPASSAASVAGPAGAPIARRLPRPLLGLATGPRAPMPPLAPSRLGRRRQPSRSPGERQRDLALRIDLVDADLDLLAERERRPRRARPACPDRAGRCGPGRRGRGGC